MPQHNGPVALITGAGSGIGRALALEASKNGIALVLVGRREAVLVETAALIGDTVPVHLAPGDITKPENRGTILQIAQSAFGRLDYLVNNAGSVVVDRFESMDMADFDKILAVNVLAPAALIQAALPLLMASKKGRVVNIGSMFGEIAFPRFAAYSATKFALRGLSEGLRRELAADGIGVTYAAPRATKTPAAGAFDALVKPMEMVLDPPERIAKRIWSAALAGRSRVYPGAGERFITILQSLFPGIPDGHIAKLETRVRSLNL